VSLKSLPTPRRRADATIPRAWVTKLLKSVASHARQVAHAPDPSEGCRAEPRLGSGFVFIPYVKIDDVAVIQMKETLKVSSSSSPSTVPPGLTSVVL
jgi:hypothetical protein